MSSRISYILLFSLSFFLWQCGSDAPPEAEVSNQTEDSPVAKYVTITAKPAQQSRHLNITGRTQAIESVQLVAEVPGKILGTKKLMNEGVRYGKGDLMLQIDDAQYRLNLKAQKSQFQTALVRIMSQLQLDYPAAYPTWDAYLQSFDESKTLAALPKVEDAQLRYFLSANNVMSTFYSIKSAEELLPKYRIYAPFSGIITKGNLSAGAVVAPGVPLASFSRTDVYELKAAVSSADIQKLKVGQKVELYHDQTDVKWTGTVHRFGGTIDPSTQAVPVFIRVSGKGLREGMYLQTELKTAVLESVVALPLQAVTRNNQVHLIRDSIVVLQDITPVHYEQQQVWVSGLAEGDLVIREEITSPIVGTKAVAKF